MIGRFFRWWGRELASLVPGSGGGNGQGGPWLRLELDPDGVRARVSGPRPRDLGRVAPGAEEEVAAALRELLRGLDPERLRCRLVVPRALALASEVELPLAAEENLREVLGFEMSRHTPFQADDVHFGYRVTERDSARQRCRVSLEVVPRGRVAAVMAALRDWDLEPEAGPSGSTGADTVELAFRSGLYRERSFIFQNTVLALAVLALAAVVVWTPVSEQRRYRDRLAGEITRARAAAAEVSALRDRLEASRQAGGLIAGARSRGPSMVVLLESITRALPDGTYLYRLQAAAGEVNLHGSSSAASSLIGILESTPHLSAVRFASPVTRDGRSARERFHIIAEMEAPAPGAGGDGAGS